jgi:hypothetical protein
MNFTEEQLRLLFLSVINNYANTYDDRGSIEYGVERAISIFEEQKTRANTNSTIQPIERQNKNNSPDFSGNMERFTNEYNLDRETEIKEL